MEELNQRVLTPTAVGDQAFQPSIRLRRGQGLGSQRHRSLNRHRPRPEVIPCLGPQGRAACGDASRRRSEHAINILHDDKCNLSAGIFATQHPNREHQRPSTGKSCVNNFS
jgi:hypothetical protein